jgi:hypothetical protein
MFIMYKILAVSCISFLLSLALKVECRSAPSHHTLHVGSDNIPRASSIGHHHHQHHHTNLTHDKHSSADDPTEELVMNQENSDKSATAGTDADVAQHQIVKRSTDADISVEKENTVTIDWKSLMVTLSEIIRKLFEFVSNTFKKLQERLLQAFVPFFPSADHLGHPAVVTSASVDWRSAGTTLFNTLVKFQHLRKNEVW